MKTIIFIAAIAFAAAGEFYELTDLDMAKLTKNPQELKTFADCLNDKAPCPPLYKTHKAIVQEAVEQKCAKCSPFQKRSYWTFLQGLKSSLPDDDKIFRQKFDPDNKYLDNLESLAQAR